MLYLKNSWRFFLAVMLCLLSVQLPAAEKRMDASLTTATRYTDNLRLLADVKDSTTSIILQPKIKMKIDDKVWDFNLDGSMRASRYVSDNNLNNDSVFLTSGITYKTELSRYGLNIRNDDVASLNRSSKTILPDAGKDEEQWNRKTQNITSSWQRQISEDTDINVSLGYTEISYTGAVPNGFSGYNTTDTSLSYGWSFSERSRLDSSISLTQFENEFSTFLYDQSIYQISYGYSLNQTDSLQLSVGKRVLDSVFVDARLLSCDFQNPFTGECLLNPVFEDVNLKNDGNVINMSFNGALESAKYSVDAARTVIPSSVGGAQEQDRVGFNYQYSINARISTSLRLSSTKTTTLEGNNTSRDSERETLNASLVYRLSQNMNIRVSYQYLNILYLSDGIDRVSNAISINLYTAWPRLMSTY